MKDKARWDGLPLAIAESPLLAGERVTGPVRGYYIAAWACPVGPLGDAFIGYYKVCDQLPSGYFDRPGLLAGCGAGQPAPMEDALARAEAAAREQLAGLPELPQAPAGAHASRLEGILYVSRAVRPLSPEELGDLLRRSRERNNRLGLTGVMLHHNGDFMQYIEGPTPALELVWSAIKASPLHSGVIKLSRDALGGREFSGWSMAFASSWVPGQRSDWGDAERIGPQLLAAESASFCRQALGRFWRRALRPVTG